MLAQTLQIAAAGRIIGIERQRALIGVDGPIKITGACSQPGQRGPPSRAIGRFGRFQQIGKHASGFCNGVVRD